jgi:hypothetical protein
LLRPSFKVYAEDSSLLPQYTRFELLCGLNKDTSDQRASRVDAAGTPLYHISHLEGETFFAWIRTRRMLWPQTIVRARLDA